MREELGETSRDIGRQRFLNNLGSSRNKKVVTVAGTRGWNTVAGKGGEWMTWQWRDRQGK